MLNKFILYITFLGMSFAVNAQIDRSVVPTAQPNPEIKIEIPDAMTFSNGLKVIMVENHKLPKVSFQLYIDYPYELEGTKAGLSEVFGEMLAAGTKNTPKDAFDEKIDFIGADFYPNSRGFYASSLKKHSDDLLSLMSEVITQPAFLQEDFDRVITQFKSNLASLPSEASSISSNVSSVVKYGINHPYGEIMTEETLDNLTLEDVNAYYKKYFIPNYAYLVVVGDVSRVDVKDYIEKYFDIWEKGTNIPKSDFIVPNSKGNHVYFVNKPGAVQSVININHTIKLTPGHPDEIKLSMLNQILGGGSFSARLMSNLREDKAYTYGCYSTISSDQLIGSFYAGGSFRNEVTDSAIVEILAEIAKISESGVAITELDLIKKSMTGSFARSLENPQTIARFALNTIRYNLPSDYYATYLQRLEKITADELLLVAAQYLQPNNLNIVVVGNEEIAEKLNRFDADGKIDFKNYYGEDEEQLEKAPDNVTAESVINSYLMKVMQAKNEAELKTKLASVQQIETISRANMDGFKLYVYDASGAPNKSAVLMYVKSTQGNMIMQQENFDGVKGGTVTQGVFKPYEGGELYEKQNASFPISQLANFNNDSVKVELLGISSLKDVPHYKIKVTENNSLSFEYYNVETGLLTMTESFVTVEGEEITIVTNYLEYAVQSGLLLPKNLAINQAGQVFNLETIYVVTNKKAKSKSFNGDFKKVEKLLKTL